MGIDLTVSHRASHFSPPPRAQSPTVASIELAASIGAASVEVAASVPASSGATHSAGVHPIPRESPVQTAPEPHVAFVEHGFVQNPGALGSMSAVQMIAP